MNIPCPLQGIAIGIIIGAVLLFAVLRWRSYK